MIAETIRKSEKTTWRRRKVGEDLGGVWIHLAHAGTIGFRQA